jgi:hypothetical protein
MKIETTLKNYIIERYGSVRAFAIQHRIAYTTVASVLKRGIDNSSVTTIVRICDALNLSSDHLIEGRMLFKSDLGAFIEIKEPKIDLNDLLSQCKWTLKNNTVELDGHILTEQEINTISTAIDISLEMIKQNARS